VIGVDKSLGSVEVGKIANLIMSDGDQLEFKTSVKHMFINGKPAEPSSRRPQLWDMFVQGCEIRVSTASDAS